MFVILGTSKLCYWSISKVWYWSTSKLCYMSTSKLVSLSHDQSHDRKSVRPPHNFIFFMHLHPVVRPPLHPRPLVAEAPPLLAAQPPPCPPLSRGAATPPTTLPLLQTAPDDIFDSDSDYASARKKEGTRWVRPAPGAHKIYHNKLCYMSSSKMMYY
jgi:hypothetical protein